MESRELPPRLNVPFMLNACILLLALVPLCIPRASSELDKPVARDDEQYPGSISIDCGSIMDYQDEDSGIWYQTDKGFVETGINQVTSSTFDNLRYYGKQLNTLRYFPEGERNCYTLKPKRGKNNRYLIRAFFAYGNYDDKNQTASFELHLGVNLWRKINITSESIDVVREVIHTPSSDTIHVCLVKTGPTIPFISSLEFRPLMNSSIYQNLQNMPSSDPQPLLALQLRVDVGSPQLPAPYYNRFFRYHDDNYDRVWRCDPNYKQNGWFPLWNQSIEIGDIAYNLPSEVWRNAAESPNVSSSLRFNYGEVFSPLNLSFEYYVYFHFAEIEQLPAGQKRIIDITINSTRILSKPLVLEYLKPVTLNHVTPGFVEFSITATSNSDAPPILNAFEIYKLITNIASPTDDRDVGAIVDIKSAYQISRSNWQGDPCLPKQYAWEGLVCTSVDSDTNPRITSLNLSSSKLTGHIIISFSYLTELESLDLSHNQLEGPVPEFLAKLPKLQVLNLTGNRLSGPIPKALKERANLLLSVADNPDLCMKDSCKKKNFVVPLVASLSALTVILLISLGFRIFRRQKGSQPRNLINEEDQKQIKLDELSLFDFEKLAAATNNFHSASMLGKGGFGPVYKGILENGQEIAVKRLSKASGQGLKELMNEVEVISKLQHRNLVRVLGCCIERDEQMLVYEFMLNKSLDAYLFDPLQKKVLDWRKRFNIIEGIARGILYLQRDSRLRIIHRDLKASNILLDDEMNPKISDFGLARIFKGREDDEASTKRIVGTYGYMPPEYAMEGLFSEKSDVYSFGVLLLEIVSGRRNTSFYNNEQSLSLVGFAWKLWNEENIISLIDPETWDPCFESSMLRCIQIGLLCLQELPRERPTISTVVLMLISEITHLPPPRQVAFVQKQNLPSAESSQKNQTNSYNNVTLSEIQGR